MSIKDELSNIEFLVFSSHKTATQTIALSLNSSGIRCLHCHTLENVELGEGEFRPFLNDYRVRNSRKLRIISVFRDPLDRIVSSFFQSLSEEVYAYLEPDKCGDVTVPEDSIIPKVSSQELLELFYRYCREIDGWGESLFLICRELGIPLGDLKFLAEDLIGVNQLCDCCLYLMRFDLMLPHLSSLLARVTGKDVRVRESNFSSGKFYAQSYLSFRQSLRIPRSLIRDLYEPRRSLIELFCPGQYAAILDARINQYGQSD